ncbi:MAG: nickel pincer cofactor biosynthesis protein LarC [Nitrospiraceae bacterium]|nr:nickel pincer cofactor biosynthesis protein LarC [Nitrospiraceae bacterium]
MKIAYFDCFSGISGDMCLGALVDAGVPPEALRRELKKIPVSGYALSSRKVVRCGISATKVDVGLDRTDRAARTWKDIEKIIAGSSLSPSIKKRGTAIFRTLFEAEARVHGRPYTKIHLHELGAVDCIVDIFGTLIGLEMLGVSEVYASPVNVGGGTLRTCHGILPAPAPAAMELLKGTPVYAQGEPFEKTTPTGAVLITSLSRSFGGLPAMIPETAGNGAGDKDPETMPNIVRLIIGNAAASPGEEGVFVIETNIDDMNPQIYEYVSELLFDAGALDVYLTQIMMKKMRPAVRLSVLCRRNELQTLADIILRETSSIGIRFFEASRIVMERETGEVRTSFGKTGVKFARYGSTSKVIPEYEDCRRIAREKGLPLSRVIETVRAEATSPQKKGKKERPGR